jgi:hypothetical protein
LIKKVRRIYLYWAVSFSQQTHSFSFLGRKRRELSQTTYTNTKEGDARAANKNEKTLHSEEGKSAALKERVLVGVSWMLLVPPAVAVVAAAVAASIL